MGLSPRDVDQLSVWEYFAILEGYSSQYDKDGGDKLSEGEKDELWDWITGDNDNGEPYSYKDTSETRPTTAEEDDLWAFVNSDTNGNK